MKTEKTLDELLSSEEFNSEEFKKDFIEFAKAHSFLNSNKEGRTFDDLFSSEEFNTEEFIKKTIEFAEAHGFSNSHKEGKISDELSNKIKREIKDPEEIKLYTINQVAKKLGKSFRTVRKWVKSGILKTTKSGLITEDFLNEYLKGN